jgi:hypothetical protein
MKKLKVVIELTIKGDVDDTDTIKEDVYTQLQELMEEDDLHYDVIDPDEDEEEDEFDYED